MAKFRETPCKFYVCLGQCQKGRNAEYRATARSAVNMSQEQK